MTENLRSEAAPAVVDDCWNRIGVGGDRTCPELVAYVHCRNCHVFTRAARSLFDRPPPEGYRDACSSLIAEPTARVERDVETTLVFRLHDEWLAFPSRGLAEVTTPRLVRRVPHRSNPVFAGLVNVSGQILPAVSLHGLLGVDPPEDDHAGLVRNDGFVWLAHPRLVVIAAREERWAFNADEVAGIVPIARDDLKPAPSTLTASAHGFSRAIFQWQRREVGLLADDRVFAALRSHCR